MDLMGSHHPLSKKGEEKLKLVLAAAMVVELISQLAPIYSKMRQVHRKFTSAFLSYDNPFMSVSQPPTASQQQKGSNLHFILNVYIKPAQYLIVPRLAFIT